MSAGDKIHQSDSPNSRARGPSAPLSAPAAHDINNPLETLLNLLYLLESETLSDKGRRCLRLAQEEVVRIGQIARAALNQSRNAISAHKENVGQLLAAVLEFYQQRIEASRISVQSRYSSDGNIPVHGEQLRRVFSNLLLNAVEAMPEGGNLHVRVSAGHEWRGDERHGVRVTIADSGCGIASDLLPQLFERSFTTKVNGHGMGLALVKDVVRQHHGWLHVRSSTQPGRHGTAFTMFLPAA